MLVPRDGTSCFSLSSSSRAAAATLARAAASIASTSFSAADFPEGAKPAVVGRLNAEDGLFAGSMFRLTKEPPLLLSPLAAFESAAVFDRRYFKTCLEGAA